MESTEKVNGKSINRIPKGYQFGEKDWWAQLEMLLPDGVTCKDCNHCKRCCMLFDSKPTDTSCQFHPNKFSNYPAN